MKRRKKFNEKQTILENSRYVDTGVRFGWPAQGKALDSLRLRKAPAGRQKLGEITLCHIVRTWPSPGLLLLLNRYRQATLWFS
jgi:hypothetical protein